jgi:glycosyltransferase involved in cell wall biosynthesis
MKFSVITPSHNQLEWLELCIASVADQHGVESVEHIICDGGSSGIEEFRKTMKERFPDTTGYRLEFVVGPDAGMYDAINKGLRRAKGNVCSYLNCDEQLLPGALEHVRDFLQRHPRIEVVFGDSILVDQHGLALCYWRPYVPTLNHLAGATLNTLSCSTFFRRSIVDEGQFFEPQWKTIGDLQWVRSLLVKRRSMACFHRPLAAFASLGENLGASRLAKEEFEATRTARRGALRTFRRAIHFARKLASGAYMRRNVTYDLFAFDSSGQRRRYNHPDLGWTWPGSRG